MKTYKDKIKILLHNEMHVLKLCEEHDIDILKLDQLFRLTDGRLNDDNTDFVSTLCRISFFLGRRVQFREDAVADIGEEKFKELVEEAKEEAQKTYSKTILH